MKGPEPRLLPNQVLQENSMLKLASARRGPRLLRCSCRGLDEAVRAVRGSEPPGEVVVPDHAAPLDRMPAGIRAFPRRGAPQGMGTYGPHEPACQSLGRRALIPASAGAI